MDNEEENELIEIAKKNLELMKETEEILEDINNINEALDGKEV